MATYSKMKNIENPDASFILELKTRIYDFINRKYKDPYSNILESSNLLNIFKEYNIEHGIKPQLQADPNYKKYVDINKFTECSLTYKLNNNISINTDNFSIDDDQLDGLFKVINDNIINSLTAQCMNMLYNINYIPYESIIKLDHGSFLINELSNKNKSGYIYGVVGYIEFLIDYLKYLNNGVKDNNMFIIMNSRLGEAVFGRLYYSQSNSLNVTPYLYNIPTFIDLTNESNDYIFVVGIKPEENQKGLRFLYDKHKHFYNISGASNYDISLKSGLNYSIQMFGDNIKRTVVSSSIRMN